MSIDATVGGSASNSFATLAEANTYFDGRLNSSDWTSATDPTKEDALLTACQRLNQEQFIGYPSTGTQALKWPRTYALKPDTYAPYGFAYFAVDEIPTQIKYAQFEIAVTMLGNSGYLAPTGLENFKRVVVGPIEIETRGAVSSGVIPDSAARYLRGLTEDASYMVRA